MEMYFPRLSLFFKLIDIDSQSRIVMMYDPHPLTLNCLNIFNFEAIKRETWSNL